MHPALAPYHPVVARWFERTFGEPTPAQAQGWPAIQSGQHTLIAAPTGEGKTLAAFYAALNDLFVRAQQGNLTDATHILYISPLKALSNDIHKNLETPLRELSRAFDEEPGASFQVRAAVRTGDTPPAERAKMVRNPPHIIVTTPESFYLLLTSESGRNMLREVRTVIVDEIHALVSDRRGAHLSLSLERLEHLVSHPLQRIGLSATQKPLERVAQFLVGSPPRACTIVDATKPRPIDLQIEVPNSPLEAVMSLAMWEEVFDKLATLIKQHKTTLVFANTRRATERITHALSERLGDDAVTSHHGSLSTKLRHRAETRLKHGELKALVATASLELGIDIGSVDLVCQIGATKSIATFVQRIGRADHKRGGTPKGRLFPTTRDDLIECIALCRAVERHQLDASHVPENPLDVLAQHIVAAAACDEWEEDALYQLCKRAFPYRHLTREDFISVVHMLSDGFTTRRGKRGARIYYDAVGKRIRPRRGSRLVALTNAGAIPENADYRVELEPEGTFIGTINEDFAIESMAGDIFQLGNNAWQITRVLGGVVRVVDAKGQPPSMPFWLGEAPARSHELSELISNIRSEVAQSLSDGAQPEIAAQQLAQTTGVVPPAAHQAADYLASIHRELGRLPTQQSVVIERFFDEAGGMQLVIHSPFGGRLNRAWGLALRKRFCRNFNFELQAAATEDAIVLSLGETHSFPLDEVTKFLSPHTVRDVLVQALLDAPMFQTRWRWVTNRALAVLRRRGGNKVPANIQRMEAEDLIAVVFPDQLACLENIQGEREIPDHPLVQQTIEDCLHEAMDIEHLVRLLTDIEAQRITVTCVDLPSPSPAAAEIITARPYAFLDDAPLEERRTRAVVMRRALDASHAREMGALDPQAIEKVATEAWPQAENPDEVHDALMQAGLLTTSEASSWTAQLQVLVQTNRATMFEHHGGGFWCAVERVPLLRPLYVAARALDVEVPQRYVQDWNAQDAARELLRARLEVLAVTTPAKLCEALKLESVVVQQALYALEAQGYALRGFFAPAITDEQWCERRLLARIHRLTLNRLRAEIEPIQPADYYRFLLHWQGLVPDQQAVGTQGLLRVVQLLHGCEIAASAWESHILPARVRNYDPDHLDQLCLSGQVGWGRLSASRLTTGRAFTSGPLRATPIALFMREDVDTFRENSSQDGPQPTGNASKVWEELVAGGAQFYSDLHRKTRLLPSQLDNALGELVGLGRITSDGFAGLRALITPAKSRHRRASRKQNTSALHRAGRWSTLPGAASESETRAEAQARVLLQR